MKNTEFYLIASFSSSPDFIHKEWGIMHIVSSIYYAKSFPDIEVLVNSLRNRKLKTPINLFIIDTDWNKNSNPYQTGPFTDVLNIRVYNLFEFLGIKWIKQLDDNLNYLWEINLNRPDIENPSIFESIFNKDKKKKIKKSF